MTARPVLNTIGGIGAVLTCPCHVVPLVLLAGGTVAGAWLGQHLPVAIITLAVLFAESIGLLLLPDGKGDSTGKGQSATGCATCATGARHGSQDLRQATSEKEDHNVLQRAR